jgi:hypothetical protein
MSGFDLFDARAFLRQLSQPEQLSQAATPEIESQAGVLDSEIGRVPPAKVAKPAKADEPNERAFPAKAAQLAKVESPPQPLSALVFVPRLGREIWIASDHDERARLQAELAAEGDNRPVIIAHDIMKLAGKPRALVDAAVNALVDLGGTVSDGPNLPPLAPGDPVAVWLEYGDGDLVQASGMRARRGSAAKRAKGESDEQGKTRSGRFGTS